MQPARRSVTIRTTPAYLPTGSNQQSQPIPTHTVASSAAATNSNSASSSFGLAAAPVNVATASVSASSFSLATSSAAATNSASSSSAVAAKRRRIGGAGVASTNANAAANSATSGASSLADRAIQLAPECGAYRELARLEARLDEAIKARRVALYEAQRRQTTRPKRRLRLQLSSHFGAFGPAGEPGWELRIEGRGLDDGPASATAASADASGLNASSTASSTSLSATSGAAGMLSMGDGAGGGRRRFTSYLDSLVVELDRELYDSRKEEDGRHGLHLAEWSRAEGLHDTDGFVIRRAGESPVRVTILIAPAQRPPRFRLQPQLARLFGLHTGTRADAVQAFWRYATEKSLLDPHDRAALILDAPLADLFRPDGQSPRQPVRVPTSDVPRLLQQLLLPPEPLCLRYLVSAEAGVKRCVNYELELDGEDPVAMQAAALEFPMSGALIQELNATDVRIADTVEQINAASQQAEFFGQFAKDPQQFLTNTLLKSGSVGGGGSGQHQQPSGSASDPDEERRAGFFQGAWLPEATSKYFADMIDQRRQDLEKLLDMH